MSNIKLGCETYTWQMPGEQYKGKLEHIMDVCAKAGFDGIEPESSFLRHLEDPVLMKEALDRFGLEYAVLAVVEDWLHPEETPEERARADKWLDYLAHFPDTILLLVHMPQEDRSNLRERQENCIKCCNAFGRRAADRGITVSKHPNSPEGSVFRIESDYEMMMENLDLQAIGYCPDVGHIAKGGMDPLSIIQKYRSHVNLVHYKDMFEDGRWAQTGEGSIDFVGITNDLKATAYEGWIIMEDEADEAITNPDGVTEKDGIYFQNVLKPLL